MEKNSIELKAERSAVITKLETLRDLAVTEKRSLTTEENTDMDSHLLECDELDVKILRAEKLEAQLRAAAATAGAVVVKPDVDKETRNWSLFKAVNEIKNGSVLSGLEAEMHQEAETEARSSLAGIGLPSFMTEKRAISQGTSAIAPVAVASFVDALQAEGLFDKVGINDLGTVAADQVLPIAGGSTVAWASEVAAAANGGADFGKLTLTPKRLTGYANISNVLLAQNGQGVENSVMRDMGRNMATKIDAAMFGSANVTNAPGCIAATSGTLTFTETTTAAGANIVSDMLKAIQTIANNHGLSGNLAFVNNWNMYSLLMSAAKVASVAPAYVDGKLLGFDGHFSAAPAVGTSPATGDGIFGDFSRVTMAKFGPSNILVDQYTRAVNNEVQLVMNNFYGFGVASGASFVKYTSLV